MMATEFYLDQEAGDEESTTLLQDPYDDEEETLSLSDLPIYSGDHSISSAQWGDDNFNKEDVKNSQNDEDDDDFFEFFSEEFTTSTRTAAAENIIFCGKLIPIFKDLPPLEKENMKKLESNNSLQKGSSAHLPSYEDSFKKGAKNFTCEYSSSSSSLSSRKVSLVRSTTKSRWFLFMFGMSRLSSNTEMELSDIRSRQRRSRSRRGPVAVKMFPAPEYGEEEEIKVRKNYKGLWKVLRSISLGLGCKSSKLANDVVKAAFV